MRSLFRLLFLAILLPLSGCTKKLDPLAAAQHFFDLIGSGQTDAAFHSAAFGFQAQRTSALFAAAAKDMGLTDYVGGDWEKPERQGRSATIRVKIKTRSGVEIPLIVTMVDEAGAWRVFSLRSPPSKETGLSENHFSLVGKAPNLADAVTRPVPPEKEIQQLVREHLLRFNEAISSGSFDAFYDSVSAHWREQLTKGQLQRAFQPFMDRNISVAEVEKATPVFDAAPAVNSEGLLIVNGHYDTQPYRIQFAMKFFYELPVWKLFGLDVNLIK